MKIIRSISILLCTLMLTSCGSSDSKSSTNTTPDDATSQIESKEDIDENLHTVDGWKVRYEIGDWSASYSSFYDSLDINKTGCYNKDNSTISVTLDNLSAEDSRIGSKEISSWIEEANMTDFDFDLNGVSCPAYRMYVSKYKKTVNKIFYPLNSKQSLQFVILKYVGDQQGVDPETEEVKQIMQSIVDENDFSNEITNADPAIIDISYNNEEYSGTKCHDKTIYYIQPEGWNTFTSSYGGIYVIKGGESSKDYGEKPSILIEYKEVDAHTAYASEKKYNNGTADITVKINGVEYEAFQHYSELESKNVYWNYTTILMPISDTLSLSVQIANDSSKYEGLNITDEDVKQILITLQDSISQ